MTDRMKKYSGQYLVDSFIDYYRQKGHTVVPSANLVPDDPTLLFTAAGMVPFKAYYSDPDAAPYSRAASVQKCLRAGGKQSDLENVGRTLRHHTFFEMLGNFSFGDYFKKEAIETAWELSVDVWKMDSERIWVSVFQEDDEAYDLWVKHIGIPEDRMVRLGKKDNFWGPVGDTGVCGPSSELYYDTRRDLETTKNSRPGDDDERFIEFWNLVFPQFFFTEQGKYDPLPRPGIDTGLGLERLAFILQEVEDNFHTDIFLPVRTAIENAMPAGKPSQRRELAVNAAADHVRALTFTLAEGVYPSNEGRGYVLRRLLRRAVTKLHPFGVKEPMLAAAVDAVVEQMKQRYPELPQSAGQVKRMITAEESHFQSTIEQGWNRLNEVIENTKKRGGKTIDGDNAFVLYDTFGFPLELTTELALDSGLDVDQDGYHKAMGQQKERSRKHRQMTGAVADATATSPFDVIGKPCAESVFHGYEEHSCEAVVDGVRVRDGRAEFTTDRTVFYPVGGGQVGDRGTVSVGGKSFSVIDAFRENGRIVHVVDEGAESVVRLLKKSPGVTLKVDDGLRRATERNHTGTHLLHRALRDVLGDHVSQAGSLVAPDRLRFDFHHFQGVTKDELKRITDIVNETVRDDLSVSYETVPYKQAIEKGAMALFGEKYGDEVRMVTIGDFSMELCGGTHLRHTGEIGAFAVAHESSVAAGVRRVEALTGEAAISFFQEAVEGREELAALLSVAADGVSERVRSIQSELEALRRELSKKRGEESSSHLESSISNAKTINGVKLVTHEATGGTLNDLRQLADKVRDRVSGAVGVLGLQGEKRVVIFTVSDDVMKERSIKANDLTKLVGKEFSLRGGGKPHMAQLGLTEDIRFSQVTDFVEHWLGEK